MQPHMLKLYYNAVLGLGKSMNRSAVIIAIISETDNIITLKLNQRAISFITKYNPKYIPK